MSGNDLRWGISLPLYNSRIGDMGRLASLAETAGFDSVWSYEMYHDPYLALALAAQATERIHLGTGLAMALDRTPFDAANTVADVDELARGRMIFGVGTGGPEQLESFHGLTLTQPLQRIREYVHCLRLTWQHLGDHKPAAFEGRFYQINLPTDPLFQRDPVRTRVPVYLGGMRPRMTQLAGEIADGLIGYFQPPAFIRDVAVPNLRMGAQRAGRNPDDIDMVTYIITSASPDRAEALRRARIHVGVYIALTTAADEVISHYGLEREQNALRESFSKQGPSALEKTDDKLVDAFSITGTPDECRKKFSEYRPHLKHALLHTPATPPILPEESADAFRNIVETFGH